MKIEVAYEKIGEGSLRDELESDARDAAEAIMSGAPRLYNPELVLVRVDICGAEVGHSSGYWLGLWYDGVCIGVLWHSRGINTLLARHLESCSEKLFVVDMYHHFKTVGGDAQ